ncbi:MAG: DUF1559 domain-containing protein, partial [Planctomycetales bacterium]|nr:DUF1559 domain-containing protein [Planctomycetales bacterium]
MSRRFSAAPTALVRQFRTKLGFTIVELLVVVAIIGILVAIILPSLGAARESARRTQCFNNLRNLGGATLNYVAAKQKYPPAATMRTGSVPGRTLDPTRHSFLTFLLPYFDQANLYQQIDLSQDWNSAKNEPLTKQNLGGVLLCPSAPSGREDKHASDYNAAVRVDSSEKSGIGQLIQAGLVQDRSKTSGPNWGNG